MKDFVEYVAKALVETPESVEVRDGESDEEGRGVIELRVAPDDRGKVIGKRGRMAHNLRVLLAAAGRSEAPVTLEIVD